jgi:hypothetical protein
MLTYDKLRHLFQHLEVLIKWIKDFNIRHETLKLLQNIDGNALEHMAQHQRE